MLSNIRIVLVETSHPGNIGAAARAMKTMRLGDLRLVRPRFYPNAEATARASGADDLLERAQVHGDLAEALGDCRLVVGASARLRSVDWPQLDPRASAEKLLPEATQGPVAVVFGRENSGLTNEELSLCNYLVHIPTNPDYSSLNLAMAVQVVAYELNMAERAAGGGHRPEVLPEVAPPEVMEGFYRHLEQAIVDIGFSDPSRSQRLLLRLRRLFARARPDRDELNILRGILSACQGRKSMRTEVQG
ncbi:MAG: tRNA (cytosine(32)/uridine(32)-2'-O)-methyltransferase TrmJ [Gammaproteobacteria bacterium RIFOXYA12_FULL_61_12]|nr:MAG: tRNA (cytosine(32)/uridine(32)-2'-O)-methyltransferase TrmJ [Gammaproteobacteria bacterium RIFOXYD12_FULL_61_37]OGT93955.1 MAG: tRNA (cytosine(32)/uridine(32)-2'-O)-methyltransferase TrmJ [Gammaproteobacteria bacterium RIFOXYA12_FULL_61_12]